MCTAITFQTKDHYFGRNLDLEYSYRESVVITPRSYPLRFRCKDTITQHFALIGMAIISDDYPLYFDATNEAGLSMAGLNFPGNAAYLPFDDHKDNITPFEIIPWILGQCRNVSEAKVLLDNTNLVDICFSDAYPLSPLHWIIADHNCSLTVEPMPDGIKVYENPIGVLTNNPPFDYHLYHLADFMNVTSAEPENRFSDAVKLPVYSRGMGSIGLPGDLSSASRFVKAAFTKLNSRCGNSESESISQFFHILGSVAQQNGCAAVGHGYEKTVYSSCCNVDKGIYYYTTYENSQISAVSLFNENLSRNDLIHYPLITGQQIRMVN